MRLFARGESGALSRFSICLLYTSYEAAKLDLPEGFYRLDAYECYDNISLWSGRPCLQFFNSTVEPSILEFYPSVGVKRDVYKRQRTG